LTNCTTFAGFKKKARIAILGYIKVEEKTEGSIEGKD
jgi:hypothetical protein